MNEHLITRRNFERDSMREEPYHLKQLERNDSNVYLPLVLRDYLDLTVHSIVKFSAISIGGFMMMGLISDLTSKHQVELQLQNLKISECRHQF
jgi:hypothetical protein